MSLAAHHASTAAVLALYAVLRARLPASDRADLSRWELHTLAALAVTAALRALTPAARPADRTAAVSRAVRLAAVGLLAAASPPSAAWLAAAAAGAVLLFPPPPRCAPPGVDDTTPAALAQATAAFDQVGGNIVVVEPAPEGQAHKYGIVALDGQSGRLNRMTGMVEKPAPGTEPSNLFISGRYILQPEIFDRLAKHRKGAGGEIQLTDAMADLMADQAFHALEYDGTTYDCGDKLGLLRANVAYALKRPDLAEGARGMLKDLLGA
jgi:UTP--glucose-1-phosphate uridylyltransferase